MKTAITWTLIFIPVLLFATYLFNAVTGGIASASGRAPEFFCGSYCIFGLGFLGLSLIVFLSAMLINQRRSAKHS